MDGHADETYALRIMITACQETNLTRSTSTPPAEDTSLPPKRL